MKLTRSENSYRWLHNYIFFMVFSILAVYSQYGAAFAVAATALVLLIKQLKEKEYKMAVVAIVMDAAAVIVAGIPLVLFFLLPQMERQGSISHGLNALSFEGNIAIDFIKTMSRTFLYLAGGTGGSIVVKVFFCVIFILLAACLVVLLIKKDDMGWLLGITCAVAFILYWIFSGLSLYAYNADGGRAYMVRYILFLEPMIAITLLSAGWRIVAMAEGKVKASLVQKATIMCVSVIVVIGGINITHTSIKDDVREAVQTYLNKRDESLATIIHYWSYPTVAFYLNGGVQQDKLRNLTVLERPDSVESSEKYQSYIDELVINEEFYYIGPKNDSLDLFLEITINREKEYIYDGDSTVLLLVREAE